MGHLLIATYTGQSGERRQITHECSGGSPAACAAAFKQKLVLATGQDASDGDQSPAPAQFSQGETRFLTWWIDCSFYAQIEVLTAVPEGQASHEAMASATIAELPWS